MVRWLLIVKHHPTETVHPPEVTSGNFSTLKTPLQKGRIILVLDAKIRWSLPSNQCLDSRTVGARWTSGTFCPSAESVFKMLEFFGTQPQVTPRAHRAE